MQQFEGHKGDGEHTIRKAIWKWLTTYLASKNFYKLTPLNHLRMMC